MRFPEVWEKEAECNGEFSRCVCPELSDRDDEGVGGGDCAKVLLSSFTNAAQSNW